MNLGLIKMSAGTNLNVLQQAILRHQLFGLTFTPNRLVFLDFWRMGGYPINFWPMSAGGVERILI
jgi:hypothetical protein